MEGRVAVKTARGLVRKNAKIIGKISPRLAAIFSKVSKLGNVRVLFMSVAARKRYMMAQKMLLMFLKKLAKGSIPLEIPKSLYKVLTRSQLKLLQILILHKKMMMEEVFLREQRAMAGARTTNSRHDLPEIDVTITPELTDLVKGRLNSYKLKLEEASKRAKGKWSAMELDRFKASIEYTRNRARSLWESRFAN